MAEDAKAFDRSLPHPQVRRRSARAGADQAGRGRRASRQGRRAAVPSGDALRERHQGGRLCMRGCAWTCAGSSSTRGARRQGGLRLGRGVRLRAGQGLGTGADHAPDHQRRGSASRSANAHQKKARKHACSFRAPTRRSLCAGARHVPRGAAARAGRTRPARVGAGTRSRRCAPKGAPAGAGFQSRLVVACASPGIRSAAWSYTQAFESHAGTDRAERIHAAGGRRRLGPEVARAPASRFRQRAAGHRPERGAHVGCLPRRRIVRGDRLLHGRLRTPQEMVLSQLDGVWTAASELARSSASASVELSALACRTASSCVAVGSVQSASGSWHPAVVNETAGSWVPPSRSRCRQALAELGALRSARSPAPRRARAQRWAYYELEAGGGVSRRPRDPGRRVSGCVGRRQCDRTQATAPQASGASSSSLSHAPCPECARAGGRLRRRPDTATISRSRSTGVATEAWGAVTPSCDPPMLVAACGHLARKPSACPGSGSCVAVGQYDAAGGAVAPMAAERSGLQRAHATEITSPPLGAGSGPGLLESWWGSVSLSDAPILSWRLCGLVPPRARSVVVTASCSARNSQRAEQEDAHHDE